METKHIIYKNFNNKNKKLNKKKFNNFLNFKILIQKYPLLKSLKKNYNYSLVILIKDIFQLKFLTLGN